MYSSLVTNLPKEIMALSENLPFQDNLPSFVNHHAVYDYIQTFAVENELHKHIALSTTVLDCRKIEGVDTEWSIQYSSDGRVFEETFEAVLVCNGHYNVPFSPLLDGIEYFQGEVLHSRDYDGPEPFRGKNVLVVGTKSSGTDLAREISSLARIVHVSDRGLSLGSLQYENLFHRPGLVRIAPDSGEVEFTDGTTAQVDHIVWCTGFLYDFPFLSENTMMGLGLTAANKRSVPGLYKQLFSIEDSSVAFIGLPFSIVPSPLFNLQAKWVAAVWAGKAVLPSKADQMAWITDFEADLAEKDLLETKYHFLGGDLQWDYCRDIASEAGLETPRLQVYLQSLQGTQTLFSLLDKVLNLSVFELSRSDIYKDVSAHRPPYPGAADSYRRRQYHLDM